MYHFAQADRAYSIRLPQGRGRKLVADPDGFPQAASRDIPCAFESEDYAHFSLVVWQDEQDEDLWPEHHVVAAIFGNEGSIPQRRDSIAPLLLKVETSD